MSEHIEPFAWQERQIASMATDTTEALVEINKITTEIKTHADTLRAQAEMEHHQRVLSKIANVAEDLKENSTQYLDQLRTQLSAAEKKEKEANAREQAAIAVEEEYRKKMESLQKVMDDGVASKSYTHSIEGSGGCEP